MFEPRHILCPIDFSDPSVLALKYAKAGARAYDAKLTVIHAETFEIPVYFTNRDVEELTGEIIQQKKAVQDYLHDFVKQVIGTDLPVALTVVEASASDAILAVSLETGTDLIVMGTHGRSGVNRFMLGSVTEKVLRQVDCPVLTVRQKEHDFIDLKNALAGVRLKHVLCPCNESMISKVALNTATSIALKFDSEVTALFSLENQEDLQGENGAWKNEGQDHLLRIQKVVRKGKAAEQIITAAREFQTDLIVLGAQHRPFFETTFFGTTTERVMRTAPCPVLVLPRKGM